MFEAFGASLPAELEEGLSPGMDSAQMWSKMSDPLPRKAGRVYPQTLSLTNISGLLEMRRKAPQALGEVHNILEHLQADVTLVNDHLLDLVQKSSLLVNKYQEPLTHVLTCLHENLKNEGATALQAFREFNKTINSAADLAGNIDKPDSIIDLLKATVSTVASPDNINRSLETLSGLHSLVLTLDKSLDAISNALQCSPKDMETLSSLQEDIKELYEPAMTLGNLLTTLPERLLIAIESSLKVIEGLALKPKQLVA